MRMRERERDRLTPLLYTGLVAPRVDDSNARVQLCIAASPLSLVVRVDPARGRALGGYECTDEASSVEQYDARDEASPVKCARDELLASPPPPPPTSYLTSEFASVLLDSSPPLVGYLKRGIEDVLRSPIVWVYDEAVAIE